MGCQCDFCINDNKVCVIEKHMHYLIQSKNSYYFPENFMPRQTIVHDMNIPILQY